MKLPQIICFKHCHSTAYNFQFWRSQNDAGALAVRGQHPWKQSIQAMEKKKELLVQVLRPFWGWGRRWHCSRGEANAFYNGKHISVMHVPQSDDHTIWLFGIWGNLCYTEFPTNQNEEFPVWPIWNLAFRCDCIGCQEPALLEAQCSENVEKKGENILLLSLFSSLSFLFFSWRCSEVLQTLYTVASMFQWCIYQKVMMIQSDRCNNLYYAKFPTSQN